MSRPRQSSNPSRPAAQLTPFPPSHPLRSRTHTRLSAAAVVHGLAAAVPCRSRPNVQPKMPTNCVAAEVRRLGLLCLHLGGRPAAVVEKGAGTVGGEWPPRSGRLRGKGRLPFTLRLARLQTERTLAHADTRSISTACAPTLPRHLYLPDLAPPCRPQAHDCLHGLYESLKLSTLTWPMLTPLGEALAHLATALRRCAVRMPRCPEYGHARECGGLAGGRLGMPWGAGCSDT
jgi:hypothetical protein